MNNVRITKITFNKKGYLKMKNVLLAVLISSSLCFSRNYIEYKKDDYKLVTVKNDRKFFVGDNGDTIEVDSFNKNKFKKERDTYRNFSKRGYDKFHNLNAKDSVKVHITLNLLNDSKFPDQDIVNDKEISNSYTELSKKFNLNGKKIGFRRYEMFLTKKQINKLIDNPLISEIDIPNPKTDSLKSHDYDFYNNFGQIPSGDPTSQSSVNVYYFANLGYTGSGVSVGVIEPEPMYDSHRNSLFNFSGFNYRSGTPSRPPTNHPADVTSIIRNTNAHSLTYFRAGGSPSANVSVATKMNGEANLFPAIDWVYSSPNNSKLINHSYSASTSSDQYAYSRYIDMISAGSPHILNVVSPGNDAANQVEWVCHTCIAVGAIWPQRTMWNNSSWMNSITNDEMPHVVAVGAGMSFPSGTFVSSGTSYSAPTITALASTTASLFSHYLNYPEVLKAAITASAIGRHIDAPFSQFSDTKSGFGVPNGEELYKISQNRFYFTSWSGTQGVSSFAFTSSLGSGSTTTRTLNVPAVSGTKKLNLVMTFFSNPDGTCVSGNLCPYDDIDITVKNSSNVVMGSGSSWTNSTEYVKFDHSSAMTYTITLKLYSRQTNKNIYGAVAWRITNN